MKANLKRLTWILGVLALAVGPVANGMRWGAS
jgi:hypothetical protein